MSERSPAAPKTNKLSKSASYHRFGLQAPLRRTEAGPLRSGKVTQLLQQPARPSGTAPCRRRRRRRDLPPALPSRQSAPAPRAHRGVGEVGASRRGRFSQGQGGLCQFRWDFTRGSRGEGGRTGGSAVLLSGGPRVSLRKLPPRSQPAPRTQNRRRGEERPPAAGPRKLGLRTGGATRLPSEPPRGAPRGSPQTQLRRRRGCRLQMPESSRIRRNFPPGLGWPPREVRVRGKGVPVDWRNPSDKFFFFSLPDARRASLLAARGMGSREEPSPGEAQAAALSDPKSGRKKQNKTVF